MVVVQHQHDLLGHPGQLVDQRGDHRLEGGRLQALQERGDLLGDPRAQRVQGGGDMAPEPRRVVVGVVQRQPGNRSGIVSGPVGQQGGLAEAGRGAHQGQLVLMCLGEPVDQPGAGHEAGTGARDVQLGRQQRIRRGGGGRSWGRCGRLGHRCPPSCPFGADGVRRRLIVELAEDRRLWSSTAAGRSRAVDIAQFLAAVVPVGLAVPADAVEILDAVLRRGQAQHLGGSVCRIGRAAKIPPRTPPSGDAHPRARP